jgi:glycosyltransferase involved in cell wall biosynthesis
VALGGDQSRSDPDLEVALESHLPESLPVGSAAAIFLYGHCFHRRMPIAGLTLVTDGVRHSPVAVRMPRRDLFEWLARTGEDPEGRSYRSGFWATLPVPANAHPRTIDLVAEVALEGGERLRRSLGSVPVVDREPPESPVPPLPTGTVAVCMATFDPDPELLRAQLDSLRAQTDERWVCMISDGGSRRDRFERLLELTGRDSRFRVSRSEQRLGPTQNFERALRMVPAEAELVALCDQDDRWYADKLASLRAALGSANLVYSDQRLVTIDGRVLLGSLWESRRNEFRNLASLLVANTVPGASMLFRRDLLDVALPFPDAPGVPYHDHWLALVALSMGEIAYLDRPLFDWVQHAAAASLGATENATGSGSRGWRAAYFGGYVMREVQARTLLLRCKRQLSARKRRALVWFVESATSPVAFAWLALRPLRRLIGRDETLGGELALVRGILWRWLIALAVGRATQPGRRAYDASFPDPPRFEQRRLRRWRAGL